MDELTERERTRCVAICRQRAELWRKTSASTPLAEALQAQARANEATYLADLLESGVELSNLDPERAPGN